MVTVQTVEHLQCNKDLHPYFFSLSLFHVQSKADGQALLSEAYRRCNLIESDYFGLEFQNMQMNWVRRTHHLTSTLGSSHTYSSLLSFSC